MHVHARSDDDMDKLLVTMCNRDNVYMDDKSSEKCPRDILDDVVLHKYEVGLFVNLMQNKLKEMDYVVVPGGKKPSMNITKEERALLQEENYFRSVQVSRTTNVWVFFQLTDEDKRIVCKSRQQKAYAAHLLYPMASDIDNLGKNQRVYVNVGYRGDPIPHVVGIHCVDKLKIDIKMFYKFRHVSHVFPNDGEFHQDFLRTNKPKKSSNNLHRGYEQ